MRRCGAARVLPLHVELSTDHELLPRMERRRCGRTAPGRGREGGSLVGIQQACTHLLHSPQRRDGRRRCRWCCHAAFCHHSCHPRIPPANCVGAQCHRRRCGSSPGHRHRRRSTQQERLHLANSASSASASTASASSPALAAPSAPAAPASPAPSPGSAAPAAPTTPATASMPAPSANSSGSSSRRGANFAIWSYLQYP